MKRHQGQLFFLDVINGDSRVTLVVDYYHKKKTPSTLHLVKDIFKYIYL